MIIRARVLKFRRSPRTRRYRHRSAAADGIVCNSTLWAACIGGAMLQDDYRSAIEAAGFKIRTVEENPNYRFISDNAKAASRKFGVKSVSLVAVKQG